MNDLLIAVLLVLGAAAVTALVGLLARHARQERERIHSAWRSVALELGGRYLSPSGPWYRRRPARVRVPLSVFAGEGPEGEQGPQVELDTYVVSTGQAAITYTRAAVDVASRHSFYLRRQHSLSGLGKAFGLQDVQVGDSEYDRGFLVKADDPAWLRRGLHDGLRRLHLRQPEAALRLKDGRLTAVRVGRLSRPSELRALLELAAAAAQAFA